MRLSLRILAAAEGLACVYPRTPITGVEPRLDGNFFTYRIDSSPKSSCRYRGPAPQRARRAASSPSVNMRPSISVSSDHVSITSGESPARDRAGDLFAPVSRADVANLEGLLM